jgi:hypothetical protein
MSTETRTAPGEQTPSAATTGTSRNRSIARPPLARQEPDWNAAEDLGLVPRARGWYDADRFGPLGRRG